MARNDTMMQYFEWYLPSDSTLWNNVTKDAKHLENIGITHVWLPPAYKGSGGVHDVGYGVYDLYDLGEFDQKGTIPTKYGTKDEYLTAIRVLRENNLKIIADIVLNHKMGADETEDVLAVQDDSENRNVSLTEATPIRVWTKYTFPGRGEKYSNFKWNWTHFHGVDWDENTGTAAIYKFYGKQWDENVDKENGNFDYLMGADIDLNNYSPYPKNPKIAGFFKEIGLADELGSGIKKIAKYTKIYSGGGEPLFKDDEIFVASIPLKVFLNFFHTILHFLTSLHCSF